MDSCPALGAQSYVANLENWDINKVARLGGDWKVIREKSPQTIL